MAVIVIKLNAQNLCSMNVLKPPVKCMYMELVSTFLTYAMLSNFSVLIIEILIACCQPFSVLVQIFKAPIFCRWLIQHFCYLIYKGFWPDFVNNYVRNFYGLHGIRKSSENYVPQKFVRVH